MNVTPTPCCENLTNSNLPKNKDGTLQMRSFHHYLPKKHYKREMERYADLDVLFGKLKYNKFFNKQAEQHLLCGTPASKNGLFPSNQLKIVWGDDVKENELNAYRIIVLLILVRYVLMEHRSCEEVPAPAYVITDIHGQFSDLLQWFFKVGGPEQNQMNLVCTGDMVDRGVQQLETVCLFLYYKLRYPNKVFILRGNHEDFDLHETYGFYAHIRERFLENAVDEGHIQLANNIWYMFIHVFDYLPVACIIEKKVFCVHAGISPCLSYCRGCVINNETPPSMLKICDEHRMQQFSANNLLEFINYKINRPVQIGLNYVKSQDIRKMSTLTDIYKYPFLFSDLVWSDPMSSVVNYKMENGDSNWRQFKGWKFNQERMISMQFGTDAIEKFIHQFNLSCIVRGHEPKPEGYQWHYLKRCITVFSAPNYTQTNAAAIVLVTDKTRHRQKRVIRINPILL